MKREYVKDVQLTLRVEGKVMDDLWLRRITKAKYEKIIDLIDKLM